MERYYQVAPLVPFGTLSSAPFTQNVTLENSILVDVEIIIPPGHGGFTGIRIRSSRQQILPWGNNDWFIADNYTKTFPVDTEIGSKSISIQAYNQDVYDHTFYVRFHIRELGTDASNTVPPSVLAVAGDVINGTFDNVPILPLA